MAVGKEALGVPSRPHRPSALERFIKSRTFRLGLALGSIGTVGYEAYHNIPAVQRAVESLGENAANHWNSLFANKDIQITPSGIPQFQPSIPAEYIIPATTGKSPEQLAKEVGYNILYKDTNDQTGRTVFYDYRGSWGGGIGESYSEQKGTDGKNYRHLIFLTGQFVKFENIDGSKDRYIILKDPKTGNLFQHIRVDFEGKFDTTEGKQPTVLSVANLSLNNQNAMSLGVDGRLGYLPQWDGNQLGRILKPGDAVGISLTAVRGISSATWREEGNNKTEIIENPFAGSITLNRFGGKAQIEKELASP